MPLFYKILPKHYILAPLGTPGDVNPFLWIGNLLRNRGHEVTLLSATAFKKPPQTLDINYCSVDNHSEVEAILKNPQLWHPWHGIRILFSFAGIWTERVFFSIQSCLHPGMENVILAPANAFGARLAREKLGVPLATVHLQPSAIQSIYETPEAHGFKWMTTLHWVWKRFFRHLPTPIDFYAGPTIRKACLTQRIYSPNHILNEWWHSPDGVLCLFPKWFAKPQLDWPTPCAQTGFPLYDTNEETEICRDLQNFLHSGSPPILFTLGSAMQHPGKFFEIALQACALLKRRALFLSAPQTSLPHPLPSYIFSCQKYVPFSWLLQKVGAVVHHGGIGTLAQALAAGIPQLVTPFAFDQPDNAARLIKLGTSRVIYPSQFTLEKVSKELFFLLTNTSVRTSCATYARRLYLENTSTRTIEFLENLRSL